MCARTGRGSDMPASQDPAVSVLMAVYNGERFVESAVRSVLTQGWLDLELIILDDGSSDGSPAILKRLAAEDPRIRLSSQPNQGVPRTANAMIAQARGRYLSLLDHDDEMLPCCLETEVSHLEQHPECIAVGVGQIHIDGAGQAIPMRRRIVSKNLPYARRDTSFTSFPPDVPFVGNTASMVRADAMRRAGGYREQFAFGNDNDLWFRLAQTGEIHRLTESLVRYRLHGGNATSARRQTVLLYDIIAHLSAMARANGRDDQALLNAFNGPENFLETAKGYQRLIGTGYPVETYIFYRAVGSRLPLATGAADFGELLRQSFAHTRKWPPSVSKLHLLRRTLRRGAAYALSRKRNA